MSLRARERAIFITAVLSGLAVNIGLDVATDVHLVVRWAAAAAAGVLALVIGKRLTRDRTDD